MTERRAKIIAGAENGGLAKMRSATFDAEKSPRNWSSIACLEQLAKRSPRERKLAGNKARKDGVKNATGDEAKDAGGAATTAGEAAMEEVIKTDEKDEKANEVQAVTPPVAAEVSDLRVTPVPTVAPIKGQFIAEVLRKSSLCPHPKFIQQFYSKEEPIHVEEGQSEMGASALMDGRRNAKGKTTENRKRADGSETDSEDSEEDDDDDGSGDGKLKKSQQGTRNRTVMSQGNGTQPPRFFITGDDE